MKYTNIVRLIESSPFSGRYGKTIINALAGYLDDCYENITELNIDDILVNSFTELSITEFNKDFNRDNVSMVYESDTDIWFLQ